MQTPTYANCCNGIVTKYDKVQRTTSRLDDFTTYDLTTFTTSRLVIDLETGFTVQT